MRLAVGAAGGVPVTENRLDAEPVLLAVDICRGGDDEGAVNGGAADAGDAQGLDGGLVRPARPPGRFWEEEAVKRASAILVAELGNVDNILGC